VPKSTTPPGHAEQLVLHHKFIKTKRIVTDRALVLENATHGFRRPNILDVKLGVRLWADDAPAEKRVRFDKITAETTHASHGFRIAGMRVWQGDEAPRGGHVDADGYKIYDKNYGREEIGVDNVADAFREFLGAGKSAGVDEELGKLVAQAFLAEVEEAQRVLESVETRMYSSSLLFIYEGDGKALREAMEEATRVGQSAATNGDAVPEVTTNGVGIEELVNGDADIDDDEDEDEDEQALPKIYSVKLIDFAHAEFVPGQGSDENSLKGIRSVAEILRNISEEGVLKSSPGKVPSYKYRPHTIITNNPNTDAIPSLPLLASQATQNPHYLPPKPHFVIHLFLNWNNSTSITRLIGVLINPAPSPPPSVAVPFTSRLMSAPLLPRSIALRSCVYKLSPPTPPSTLVPRRYITSPALNRNFPSPGISRSITTSKSPIARPATQFPKPQTKTSTYTTMSSPTLPSTMRAIKTKSPIARSATQFPKPQTKTSTYTTMSSPTLPSTMRAIKIPHTGGLEVLELHTDIPLPTLSAGQLLIKNAVAGVNYIDTYLRTGLYPPPAQPSSSVSPAREAEGVVVAVSPEGETYGFKVGDRVAAFVSGGAYAEYVAVPARTSFKLPSGIEDGLGAASLLQGLTALTLIREAHPVKKGETILVHAAAGGVGLWLCQLLRAVGAKVIATASTSEKLQLAKENGADELVNYKTSDFVAEVSRITNGAGVAAVFDGVGAATFEGSFASVARKGSLVSFGNASGPVPPFTIARLGAKNLKVLRPRLGAYVETREEFETYAKELFGFIADGKVGVKIHARYKLEEVQKAQGDLEGRGTVGKLLLVL
ncbi:hypothetical protein V495_00856, partial [Pseudogymnoascus sp. VKM F-4514 (FW-929)]